MQTHLQTCTCSISMFEFQFQVALQDLNRAVPNRQVLTKCPPDLSPLGNRRGGGPPIAERRQIGSNRPDYPVVCPALKPCNFQSTVRSQHYGELELQIGVWKLFEP